MVLFDGARVLVSFILWKPITCMAMLFIFTVQQYYSLRSIFLFLSCNLQLLVRCLWKTMVTYR